MDLWYRLINHDVSRHEIDKRPTAFLFGQFKWVNSQKKKMKKKKLNWNVVKENLRLWTSLQSWASLDPLNEGKKRCSWERTLEPMSFTVCLCAVLLQRSLQTFTSVTLQPRKGNHWTSYSLLDTGSEWLHILGDPKKHCAFSIEVWVYGFQVVNRVLVEIGLIVGPIDPWTHPAVVSPVPKHIIGIDMLRNWQTILTLTLSPMELWL